MVPLFPGVPGGPELLVILLLLVALFGVPVVAAFLGWRYLKGDRVADLEARVEELESELDADGADENATGESAATDAGDDERFA
ncbi:preprotein translocase subunit TatA [Salinigranum rubrum]|uniref:Preprotein translocase subunit TatA n=1 Tax=Salinigranum rubrum TaxID=755307 RepID=A0A2I8VGF6_9EURY|nr:preprotein translocase subunit TatA [Salinigranum rubrum]AUV81006.1 preprotein translocase subunit TatA [Salinigranum rubrum]